MGIKNDSVKRINTSPPIRALTNFTLIKTVRYYRYTTDIPLFEVNTEKSTAALLPAIKDHFGELVPLINTHFERVNKQTSA